MNVWRNTRTIKETLRKRVQNRLTFPLWLGTWTTIQRAIWPMTFDINGQVGAVKHAITKRRNKDWAP
jgi:hypothetical protein